MKCKRKSLQKKLYKYRLLLLMLVPAILYFLIFCYLPMFGIILAFKKFDFSLGIFSSPWCGINNFRFLFASGKVFQLSANTLMYNSLFIIVGMASQIFVAILITELKLNVYKKICQTIMLLPHFISWVVVGTISYNILNYKYGFLNSFLKLLGFSPINFAVNPSYWPGILVAFNTWKGLGYGSVIFIAAITGIDSEIFEAAQIDGASILQRILRITIPCLKPTVVTLLLLSTGSIFRGNFQLFYNLVGNNGLLFNKTDVIDTYVFRSLLSGSDFGMTAAAGLFQSVLCFGMIMIVNTIVKRIDEGSALF